jgi:hypothetical protein
VGDTSIENVIRMQFNLVKHGNFSISECENISYLDFEIYYDLLLADIKKQNEH